MTKAQAQARYGEPKKRTVTDEGEQWTYIFEHGRVHRETHDPVLFQRTTAPLRCSDFGPNVK